MRKKLQFHYVMFICGFLIFNTIGYAQISYSANFNTDSNNWVSDYFEQSDVLACDGAGALVGNLYEYGNHINSTSPSIGVSNGGEVSLSYKYKIVDGSEAILNEEEWGFIKVYYAITPTGPFRILQTIDGTNHIASEECATKNVTFFAPQGSDIYIRIEAEIDNLLLDYNVYIDEINITQAQPANCSGVPETSEIVTSATSLCTDANTTLSLFPVYNVAGLNYQWQSSLDGVSYTNISTDTTSSIYTTSQTESTWYRAIISCAESSENFTTDGIHISNTGLGCLCDVNFDYVEPITYVRFAGIDNTSYSTVDATPAVENFTSVPPGQVTQGEIYTITLQGNTNDPGGSDFLNYFTVFIDWNKNGVLNDAGEVYTAGTISSSIGTDGIQAISQITVPADALPGLTNLRIVKLYESFSTDPCFSGVEETYGQVEDYLVNVSAPICSLNPPTGNDTQEFVNNDPEELFLMSFSEIVIETEQEAIITWYFTEDDAASGENPHTNDDTITQSGIYYVTQTVGACTSEPFAVTVSIVLSTDHFMKQDIKYYPNPVINLFNLNYIDIITRVEVFNVIGIKVLDKSVNQKEVTMDLSSLASGMYLFKISTDNEIRNIKIIKQ